MCTQFKNGSFKNLINNRSVSFFRVRGRKVKMYVHVCMHSPYMQVSIDGIPAVTINKVMKEFAFTIHYVNEYLKRIWGFNTPASNSPTDHTDIMSDLESEYQESHLHNKDQEASKSMHVQPLEVHPDAESETDYPKDPQHSIRNDPAHQMQHFAGEF